MNAPFRHTRIDTLAAKDMRDSLNAALVALALKEPCPVERAAKLAILRRDGWI